MKLHESCQKRQEEMEVLTTLTPYFELASFFFHHENRGSVA